MLITLPNHDDITKYLSEWSKRIISVARKNGIEPIVTAGSNVVRTHITNTIKSKNPKLLILNGHGSSTIIAGHKNQTLIEYGDNHYLLSKRIVHCMSCDNGSILGEKSDCEAFIGYKRKFWLPVHKFSLNRPLQDRFAIPVMESAIQAPLELAKRKTAKEAYDKSQAKYDEWIEEFVVSDSKYTKEELELILPMLIWDKLIQVRHENPNASR